MKLYFLFASVIMVLAGTFSWYPLLGDVYQIESKTYTPSKVCGKCHQAIYDTWKNSLHAMSLSDPIFQVSFAEVLLSSGEREARQCLKCHAPTVGFTKDYSLNMPVTREGVTCDFCHTVSGIDMSKDEPYITSIGKVKRGPLKSAKPTVHRMQSSELHTRSEFCAGCHELRTPLGVIAMGTYSEWKGSSYAKRGIQCQGCHMQEVKGEVAKDQGKRPGQTINLHDLQGGHSIEQVKKAAHLKILRVDKKGGDVRVEVAVTNAGSGHMIPTGIPSRELVLEVKAKDTQGKTVYSGEETFKKTLVGRDGKILKKDSELLAKAAKVISDTRIAPEERRIVRFSFTGPRRGRVSVEAKLSYRYTPLAVTHQEMVIELGTAKAASD